MNLPDVKQTGVTLNYTEVVPHSQPTAPKQNVLQIEQQHNIFYWGSTIPGVSTLYVDPKWQNPDSQTQIFQKTLSDICISNPKNHITNNEETSLYIDMIVNSAVYHPNQLILMPIYVTYWKKRT